MLLADPDQQPQHLLRPAPGPAPGRPTSLGGCSVGPASEPAQPLHVVLVVKGVVCMVTYRVGGEAAPL